MAGVFIGVFLMIAGMMFFCIGVYDQFDLKNFVKKTDVEAAMSGNWTYQVFNCNGSTSKDREGQTHFVSSKDVQERIDKLNKVLQGR